LAFLRSGVRSAGDSQKSLWPHSQTCARVRRQWGDVGRPRARGQQSRRRLLSRISSAVPWFRCLQATPTVTNGDATWPTIWS